MPIVNVLCVDNLSAFAYRLLEPGIPASIIDLPPARIAERLQSGFGDVALVPADSIPRLPAFEMLGSFGIGSRGAVGSVLFLSKRPIAELVASGSPVHLTPASSTSIALFRVLCEMHHGRMPDVTREPRFAGGRLVIGNEAMHEDARRGIWPHRIDLGAWWYETTGKPFVFARWMIRSDVDRRSRDALEEWLASGVHHSRSDPGLQALSDRFCSVFPELTPAIARDYYGSLRLALDDHDVSGQALFLEELANRDATSPAD